MKKMYDAVLFANLDAMKAIRADISGKVADSVARSTLDAWGFGKYFGHGLGHGVGLTRGTVGIAFVTVYAQGGYDTDS